MADGKRLFAVVTGASTGIGFELAKECAENGFDLLIAADEPAIHDAGEMLKRHGTNVEVVRADLATDEGVDRLYEAAKALGRPVDALLANAGRGLGHGFLDQDFDQAMRVVDTNITGTLYLLHRFGRDMREQGFGSPPPVAYQNDGTAPSCISRQRPVTCPRCISPTSVVRSST